MQPSAARLHATVFSASRCPVSVGLAAWGAQPGPGPSCWDVTVSLSTCPSLLGGRLRVSLLRSQRAGAVLSHGQKETADRREKADCRRTGGLRQRGALGRGGRTGGRHQVGRRGRPVVRLGTATSEAPPCDTQGTRLGEVAEPGHGCPTQEGLIELHS